MDDKTTITDATSGGSLENTRSSVVFKIGLALGAVGVAYVLLWHGIGVFSQITAKLPLLLPLAVTVMSIVTRATDIRSFEAVLKTSNDIAIGIISFDIWLFSARSEPAGRVLVNASTMIRGDFALAFLVLGLVTAVVSLILTHYEFRNPVERQRALLVGFVASVLVYIAPFGVLEDVPAPEPVAVVQKTVTVSQFDVAIAYKDPAIVSIRPTLLDDRLFVHLERGIEAPSADDARASAVQRFLASDESNQAEGRNLKRSGDKVEIAQDSIVVAQKQ